MRILVLGVWSESGSRLFTYTGMEACNRDQNPIYVFTLSWLGVNSFKLQFYPYLKNYSF